MNIKILPQTIAEQYACLENIPKTLIVSIRCPGENRPAFPLTIKEGDSFCKIYDIFEMQFNDLDKDTDILKAPQLKDFQGLKQFIDENIMEVEQVLIHCGAGYSRSPGCALAIAEYLSIPNDIQSNKIYNPNLLVYKLAKQELGIDKNQDYYEDIFR